jgi:DNA-binding NarL/FixJ family response regulator
LETSCDVENQIALDKYYVELPMRAPMSGTPRGVDGDIRLVEAADDMPVAEAAMVDRDGPARILLIDDHAILRDGLRALLNGERDLRVVAEAGSVAEGIDLSRLFQPDLVILDLSFPLVNGIDAIGRLRRECDGVRILVLSIHNGGECVRGVLKAGAHGFVDKGAEFRILLQEIRASIRARELWARSQPSPRLPGSSPMQRRIAPVPKLTAREREVLIGVAQGFSSKEVAISLGLSAKTVEKHRSKMMRKLSLGDASAVARYAVANGLLSADTAG